MSKKNEGLYTYSTFVDAINELKKKNNDTLVFGESFFPEIEIELNLLIESIKKYKIEALKNGYYTENFLYEFFGLDSKKYGLNSEDFSLNSQDLEYKTKIIELKELDCTISSIVKSAPRSLLKSIEQTFFPYIGYNFNVILIVVEELINSGNQDLQLDFATQFLKARNENEYDYELLGRYRENTIQDQLIDTYFPKFEIESLVFLLSKLSEDSLNSVEGNGMESLFLPAFQSIGKTDKETQKKLEKKLLKYLKYIEDYFDSYYILDFLKDILPLISPESSLIINKSIDANKRILNIVNILEKGSISSKEEILLQLGTNIKLRDYLEIHDIFEKLDFENLSYNSLENYFLFYLKNVKNTQITSFDIHNLIYELFNKNFNKIISIINEWNLKFSSDLPFFWQYSIHFILNKVFVSAGSNLEDEKFQIYLDSFSLFYKIPKDKLIEDFFSDVFSELIRKFTNTESDEYKKIFFLLDKYFSNNALFIKFDSFFNLKDLKKIIDFGLLTKLNLTKESLDLFYKHLILRLLQQCDWADFYKYVPLFSIEKNGKYEFNRAISIEIGTYLARNFYYDDLFFKDGYKIIKKLSLEQLDFEIVLAQLILVSTKYKKTKMALDLISLLPENILSSQLAYNLAYYYEKNKDKQNLLKFVKLSIDLGTLVDYFLNKDNFKFYSKDADFLAILSNK